MDVCFRSVTEWNEQLSAARAEPSRSRTIRILTDLLAETATVANDQEIAALRATAYGLLALEQDRPADRARLWRQAVNSIPPALERSPHDPALIAAMAKISVDAFQDTFAGHSADVRISFLRKSLQVADKWLNGNSLMNADSKARGSILAAKSSLLRNLATQEAGRPQKSRLSEAVRCAELAHSICDEPAASLELGLALWARARIASTDEQYKNELQLAEASIVSAAAVGFPAAIITLPRLYRLTFRPIKCLEAWPVKGFRDTRMLLRNSYIYAEAAIAVTYSEYPVEVVSEYLADAIAILERALSAGYRNVRIVTALAFARGLSEGSDAASTALNEIALEPSGLDYQAVLSLVTRKPDAGVPADLPVEQLALGIDDGGALSSIGTFALRILDNPTLAEALYRTSIAMEPTYAIAYTNLARLLLAKGGDQNNEVMRLLQKAQTFADRRFTWWRVVLEEVNRNQVAPLRNRYIRHVPNLIHAERLRNLRERFQDAERADIGSAEDLAARGRLFERLVAALANLTVDIASGPYRQSRTAYVHEIDGYLEHRGHAYIVECKWRSTPVTKTDMEIFISKVKTVSSRGGIFFSMAGFDQGAVAVAKEGLIYAPILLVDGEEIRDLFYMRTNLDQMIEFKKRYVDKVGNPFRKFNPGDLAAA